MRAGSVASLVVLPFRLIHAELFVALPGARAFSGQPGGGGGVGVRLARASPVGQL